MMVDDSNDDEAGELGDLGDQVYAAEAILQKKLCKGRTMYKVKWKGWSVADSTWEPEENILDIRLIQQFERKAVLQSNKRGRKPGRSNNSNEDSIKGSGRGKRSDLAMKKATKRGLYHSSRRVGDNADSSSSADDDDDDDDSGNDDDTSNVDSEDSDKKEEDTSKKVPYILQTLSGRTPKPPERYEESKNKAKSDLRKTKNKKKKKRKKKKKQKRRKEDSVENSKGSGDEVGSAVLSPISPTSSTTSSLFQNNNNNNNKKKVGITIKKSPNSNRSFETCLLGDQSDSGKDDSEEEIDDDEDHLLGIRQGQRDDDDDDGEGDDDVDEDNEEEEIEDDEDTYESFKSSVFDCLRDSSRPVNQRKLNGRDLFGRTRYSPATDRKLNAKHATVTLQKVDRGRVGPSCGVSAASANASTVFPESDSEYEFEEIVELCEWYPPDFWRSQLKDDEKTSVRRTDVTVNDLTVTMRECKSQRGFFSTS